MKKKEESEKREKRRKSNSDFGGAKVRKPKILPVDEVSTTEYVVRNTVLLKVGKSESRISVPCLWTFLKDMEDFRKGGQNFPLKNWASPRTKEYPAGNDRPYPPRRRDSISCVVVGGIYTIYNYTII
jgi:hypothetical protein